MAVKLNLNDIQFILDQIKIAEAHSAGTPLDQLIGSPLLPHGLRTVDGSFNNFGAGREKWGASGELFPGLTDPSFATGSGSMGPHFSSNNDYGQTGDVMDGEPRLISNLIVDQTSENPAAIYAALRLADYDGNILNAIQAIRTEYAAIQANPDGLDDAALQAQYGEFLEDYGIELDGWTIMLRNSAPDDGVSAPFNSFFTFFGQFFDHGLDLVKKGGNGTVYMPLNPDDPLYNPATPHTNFMAISRVTTDEAVGGNVTTPWVDQNQTYTSSASHQVFLREYEVKDGKPVATGHLLEGARGLATWADVKAQARDLLGIDLTDLDVSSVPELLVDPYGEFIRGENGLPQILAAFAKTGDDADGNPILEAIYVEGNLTNPVDPSAIQLPVGTLVYNPALGINVAVVEGQTVSAARTGHAFLDDIAHSAVPVKDANGQLVADADGIAGNAVSMNMRGQNTEYDNELLDAHYITGDGRGNENIGLSAVHHIFHSEHNRQVDDIKATIEASGNANLIAQWKLPDGSWDGERLFQAARFATEMQYQHLVFEEFARKIQPDVDIFIVQPDVEMNPAIFAEFAHVIYRFGHSMLNETVEMITADGDRSGSMDLFDAFLNPLAFGAVDENGVVTVDHREAAGAIIRGMTGQAGNEIDEFVTNTLRNQLLGIPLDLAAINIARGRDTGMPTLNEARGQFMEMANGDTQLRPYESWSDFALNLRNPASIINFIAAYGTHPEILKATTIQGKRDAAWALVMGDNGAPEYADRMDFLNGEGDYANDPLLGGLQNIDLWVGGLAEKKMSFGGMLGSTFAFVFEMQMENLQDADRFYYLSRVQGRNLLTELENNSLAKMVQANTDIGETDFAIPADVFATSDHVFYMDMAKQMRMTGKADPEQDEETLGAFTKLVERRDADGDGVAEYIRYNGADHIIVSGSDGNDVIVAGDGDDAVWGNDGDDRIEAGYGVDMVSGGKGDDIITNSGTDIGEADIFKGDEGNDVIHAGSGMALIFGGTGKDFLMTGPDGSEIRAGEGDDFLLGGDGQDVLFGNEGDDWIEGKSRADMVVGDNGDIFFNSTVVGHDVLNGGQGDTDYDADSGDDIMVAGEGIQKNMGMWGHDWVIHKGQKVEANADLNFPLFSTLPLEVVRDRFGEVEALSGWKFDDILRGDDRVFDSAFEAETEVEEEDAEVEPPEDEGGVPVEEGVNNPGFMLVEEKQEEVPEVYDPTPEGNFLYNELDQAGIDRIAGLNKLITPDMMRELEYRANGSWENLAEGAQGDIKQVFVGGNILLGGGGSDLFEGRGGDDVIDGDAWLNVRISIRDANGVEIATTEGMHAKVYSAAGFELHGGRPLSVLMLERVYNPGQLHIVREILYDDSGTDRAHYWDDRVNYDFDGTSDGRLVVQHVIASETDAEDGNAGNPFDPLTGKNRTSDGRDILSNIEELQFRDGVVGIINGTAANDTLDGTDENDIMLGLDGDDIIRGGQGNDVLIGGLGNDRLFGNANDDRLIGGQGNDVLRGGTGNDTYVMHLADGSDRIIEANGQGAEDRIVIKTAGRALDGLSAHDSQGGGAAGDLVIGYNGQQVTVDDHFLGANAQRGVEFINFDGGSFGGYALGQADYRISRSDPGDNNRVGTTENDLIAGENTIDLIEGDAGNDLLFGGGGNDELRGGAGEDLLVGGQGNDTVFGGGGDDTMVRSVGDGRDQMDGGDGHDTVHIIGDSSTENYAIYTAIAAQDAGIATGGAEIVIQRNGETVALLSNTEEIVIDGKGGGDTFTVHGDFTDTNLSYNTITLEGSAAGETIDITGLASAHRIYFRSGGGEDRIIGTLRPQDVIVLPKGAKVADYTLVENEDGTSTLTNGKGHAVVFTRGEGTPQIDDGDGDMEEPEDNDDEYEVPDTGGDNGFEPPEDDDEMFEGEEPDGEQSEEDPEEEFEGEEAFDDEDAFEEGEEPEGEDQSEGDEEPEGEETSENDEDSEGEEAPEGEDEFEEEEPENAEEPEGEEADASDEDDDEDDDSAQPPVAAQPPATPTERADYIMGTAGNDMLVGLGGGDTILAGAGADIVSGGRGADFLSGDAGRDVIFGGAGDDDVLGGDGADMLYGDAGNDRILAGSGNDMVNAGAGSDVVFGGAGDDTFVAEVGDGNDTYYGDDFGGGYGNDTLDMSAITANITADLGTGAGGRGMVASSQTGRDVLQGVENIVTGSGDDVITASRAVNVIDGGDGNDIFRFLSAGDANGDTIVKLQSGDRIDLSAIDANSQVAGNQSFTLVSDGFSGAGQLMISEEMREDGTYTVLRGNVDNDDEADFEIGIKSGQVSEFQLTL